MSGGVKRSTVKPSKVLDLRSPDVPLDYRADERNTRVVRSVGQHSRI